MPKPIPSTFSFLNKETIYKNLYREWLVTNGLGSYSSGTVSGILTRRYHGLFVAALHPPLARTLYVSKVEEVIEIEGKEFFLGANKWVHGNVIFPSGFEYIEYFYLDQNVPVWIYKCSETYIEKIFMHHGKNSIYVTYKIIESANNLPIKLTCNIFVNNRDYHSISQQINIRATQNKNDIEFYCDKQKLQFLVSSNFNEINEKNIVYYNYELEEEKNRGFPYTENHILGASLKTNLFSCTKAEMNFNLEKIDVPPSEKILSQIKKRNNHILKVWQTKQSYQHPEWIKQLVLMSDAFIVSRDHSKYKDAKSIIAGYHWFSDWGRDTMISLPGLCCATGQTQTAKLILENYAHYLDKGMLPNRFPDSCEIPDYNTVDATLWYFEAIYSYYKETKDKIFLNKIYPVLESIIDWHIKGTRFQIKCDPNDGLLYAGENGLQLTWMDAKINGFVVTPRKGKPIEVNALWYNALMNMVFFANELNKENNKYTLLSKVTEKGLLRFWNEETEYCFDVIDSPDLGNDATLRPNQIIALSLKYCPYNTMQKRSIIDTCGRHLVTYFGVRSLTKFSADYKGKYQGSPYERDCAYHQGTAWSWLLGVYAIAYYNVTKNASVAIGFLEPLAKHINEAGIGYISEIFDGDAPFLPRGCIAQAWGVAETLRAWSILSSKLRSSGT